LLPSSAWPCARPLIATLRHDAPTRVWSVATARGVTQSVAPRAVATDQTRVGASWRNVAINGRAQGHADEGSKRTFCGGEEGGADPRAASLTTKRRGEATARSQTEAGRSA